MDAVQGAVAGAVVVLNAMRVAGVADKVLFKLFYVLFRVDNYIYIYMNKFNKSKFANILSAIYAGVMWEVINTPPSTI